MNKLKFSHTWSTPLFPEIVLQGWLMRKLIKVVRSHFPDLAFVPSKSSSYSCILTQNDMIYPEFPTSQSICSPHLFICEDSSRDIPKYLLEILIKVPSRPCPVHKSSSTHSGRHPLPQVKKYSRTQRTRFRIVASEF